MANALTDSPESLEVLLRENTLGAWAALTHDQLAGSLNQNW